LLSNETIPVADARTRLTEAMVVDMSMGKMLSWQIYSSGVKICSRWEIFLK
jgi:hypothetical protein